MCLVCVCIYACLEAICVFVYVLCVQLSLTLHITVVQCACQRTDGTDTHVGDDK